MVSPITYLLWSTFIVPHSYLFELEIGCPIGHYSTVSHIYIYWLRRKIATQGSLIDISAFVLHQLIVVKQGTVHWIRIERTWYMEPISWRGWIIIQVFYGRCPILISTKGAADKWTCLIHIWLVKVDREKLHLWSPCPHLKQKWGIVHHGWSSEPEFNSSWLENLFLI